MATTDPEALRMAQEILARSEYAAAPSSPMTEVLVRLLALLSELASWLEGLQGAAPLAFYALVLLILIALLGGALWVAKALRATSSPESGTRARVGGRARRDFVAEAATLAEERRYLEAVQAMVLGTLERVASARLIDLRPEWTNRRIRTQLAGSALPGALSESLIGLLERTERARFRDARADRALYDAWASLYERVDGELGRA